jgi:hypothetical protein
MCGEAGGCHVLQGMNSCGADQGCGIRLRSHAHGSRWLGPLYQSANRLAHLYFLRDIGNIEAFLLNVYFVDDPHSRTTRQEWNDGIKLVNEQLGITNPIPYAGSVFLDAV